MTTWITGEKRVKLMLKQCESCGRYFDPETEEATFCERCSKRKRVSNPIDHKHICHCGRSFVPFDSKDDTCPECKRAEFEEMSEDERNLLYRQIRNFLYDNPLTPKVKVAERFGVPLKTIDDWIHHGKLEQIDEMALKDFPEGYCKYCGVKIHRGKICKPCEARLGEKLESHSQAMTKLAKGKHIRGRL